MDTHNEISKVKTNKQTRSQGNGIRVLEKKAQQKGCRRGKEDQEPSYSGIKGHIKVEEEYAEQIQVWI